MSLLRPVVFLLGLLFAGTSVAAIDWEIKGNYVADVAVYYEVINGKGYNIVTIYLKNPISTGCALSDADNQVSYWYNGYFGTNHTAWISAALSAQAQNKKVDINTDNSVCSTYYGRKLLGLKVRND